MSPCPSVPVLIPRQLFVSLTFPTEIADLANVALLVRPEPIVPANEVLLHRHSNYQRRCFINLWVQVMKSFFKNQTKRAVRGTGSRSESIW
jgi:hypothetical protein